MSGSTEPVVMNRFQTKARFAYHFQVLGTALAPAPDGAMPTRGGRAQGVALAWGRDQSVAIWR